jgi:hypothetical protein
MTNERLGNLTFLLSFSSLLAACPGDDDGTGDTGPSPTTNDTSTDGVTTAEAEGPEASAGPTADPDVTSGPTTEADTTAGLSYCDEVPPRVGPIDPACAAHADLLNECNYDGGLSPDCLELYAAYCQYMIDYYTMEYGEACGMAQIDYYACLAQLACEELMVDGVEPCPDERMAITMACL